MMKIILVLFCIFAVCTADLLELVNKLFSGNKITPKRVRTVKELNETINDTILDFIGLVEQYKGYSAEEYKVKTQDGYILTVHRMFTKSNGSKVNGKPAVYLQHGLLCSSDFWVTTGVNTSLAFELANAGYDVWLGNVRGNSYSRSHIKYSPEDEGFAFWNFGLDEIGMYDISANIDFILKMTNQSKLTYIGYSLGATTSYILLSSKPEYNKKINILISLAPAAYFNNPPYIFLESSLKLITVTARLTNLREIFPSSTHMVTYARNVCKNGNSCTTLFEKFSNVAKTNFSHLSTTLAHIPAGASLRTVDQVLQFIKNKDGLRKYNHDCNFFACVGKMEEYNVTRITAPTAIIYSEFDDTVKQQDVEFLKNKLGNVVESIKINSTGFNHLDFTWSTLAKELVFDPLIQIIKTYQVANN